MGRVTEKVLEILQVQAEAAAYLFEIFATDYATSYKRMHRSFWNRPPAFKTDWAEWYRRRHAFHSLLNKLKRDGLVAQKEKRRNAPWHITRSGVRLLTDLKKKSDRQAVLPRPKYHGERRTGLIIVAFDVPERESAKRRWLRGALTALGFQRIQHSVWAGNTILPDAFLEDMRAYAILPYVHIFSVTKAGTLEQTR